MLRSTGEFSTLGEEIKLVESYLDIERARFEERLEVQINVPDELAGLRVPSLILQPVVENAIKHGISENKAGGTVEITAELAKRNGDRMLHLTVRDPGPGNKGKMPNGAGGVGLKNIRERLASHYGSSASFTLDTDGPNGTVAAIDLPIRKEETVNHR